MVMVNPKERMPIQNNVAQRPAAEGCYHCHGIDTDDVHPFFSRLIDSREGKGDDSQNFDCFDERVHQVMSFLASVSSGDILNQVSAIEHHV